MASEEGRLYLPSSFHQIQVRHDLRPQLTVDASKTVLQIVRRTSIVGDDWFHVQLVSKDLPVQN